MGRLARNQIAGYTYHLIQRGHNRSDCFLSAKDFELYLGLLAEFRQAFPCSIHAYALMSNHVHLLVTPREPANLSLMMKNVAQRYSQHFNRTYQRSGSLWEGRFRSCPIDTDAYLLRCQRYIELNPVRAGMVANPGDYPWSSYRYNAGMDASLFIVPHDVFSRVGATPEERIAWYKAFLATPPPERELAAIRKGFSRRQPLGTGTGDSPRGLSPV